VRDAVTRAAFTLVEVLIALAIGSLVLGLAGATSVAARRVGAVLDQRATATARTTAVPQLLAWALGDAGRGLDACAITVLDDGGRWRSSAVEPGEAVATTSEVLAGQDGGGRPALYHRTLPWARQPWLEDVVAFGVLEALDEAGTWRTVAHDATTRWRAVRVELGWSDGDVRRYEVPLPHAPCAEMP
jgi:prepilin-type N-terminal cleavage/methylation domain-containing protein